MNPGIGLVPSAKMGAMLPIDLFKVHQAEVDLVDESGGLESVAGALAGHVPLHHPAEFVINVGDEAVECGAITLAPGN